MMAIPAPRVPLEGLGRRIWARLPPESIGDPDGQAVPYKWGEICIVSDVAHDQEPMLFSVSASHFSLDDSTQMRASDKEMEVVRKDFGMQAAVERNGDDSLIRYLWLRIPE
ncbi:hypothetical protein LCGC14_1773200 [marine sediment metagenome]|uniref:Uncharacterized protein n=1 Tax=marine sediment metagenome TaxID=412755 RepID=A0A0F9GXL8_9ZZZZ